MSSSPPSIDDSQAQGLTERAEKVMPLEPQANGQTSPQVPDLDNSDPDTCLPVNNVDTQSTSRSRLVLAASEGHTEIVKQLLDEGTSVHERDPELGTAIVAATLSAHTNTMRLLCEAGASLDDTYYPDKQTLLHLAIKFGDLELVRLLIKLGVPVLKRSLSGENALTNAIVEENEEMVALLLENGADAEISNEEPFPPLILAIYSGNFRIIELLLRHGWEVDITVLNAAVLDGNLDVVTYFIDSGVDLEDTEDGMTPLHHAVKGGYLEMTDLLLEKGANIEAVDSEQLRTPFYLAIEHGNPRVAERLLDPDEFTALSMAARHGYSQTLELLIELGADIELLDARGESPLITAANYGHLETAEILLKKGAHVNWEDYDGWTPLAIAARRGYSELVRLLLERGADQSIKTKQGASCSFSVIHRAICVGHVDVVRQLSDATDGQKPPMDTLGRSPLCFAVSHGRHAVVQLLLEREAHQAFLHDIYGSTPLGIAIRIGYESVARLLFNATRPSLDAEELLGKSLRWWLSTVATPSMRELFEGLEQGAEDVEFQDDRNDEGGGMRAHCDICLMRIMRDQPRRHINAAAFSGSSNSIMARSVNDDVDGSDGDAIVISRDDISDYNPGQVLPQPEKTLQQIRAWIQPTPYEIAGGEYRKHLASHAAGTGAWLTSSATYKQWLQDDQHGLLWIKGIPGSGKSVIAAKLIDQLSRDNPGSPVVFFFFRQIIQANHKPDALLRDWMDQFLKYSPPLQKKLKSDMETRSLDSISIDEMWKNLYMAFSGFSGRIFCVADALDEIDQGNVSFLTALASLGTWRPNKVKVLVTSRPVPTVEGPLRKSPGLQIRLHEDLVDIDISMYVQSTLSNSSIPKSDWKTIMDAVPGKANGLFLYAKLAMDAFLEPEADISLALSKLPTDLDVLYTDLLREHSHRSGVAGSIQRLILQAVTHANRPLRLLELAEMIKSNSPDGKRRDLKDTKDLIRAACGPLLEILVDETVSVIHHSFTEYLKGTTRSEDISGYPILEPGPSHAQLAIVCLNYLNTEDLEPALMNDEGSNAYMYHPIAWSSQKETDLRLKHPFFEYAANNWSHHIMVSEASGEDQTEINDMIRQFLGDDKRVEAWMLVKWENPEAKVSQVHVAARLGLFSYIKELLQTMPPDEPDSKGRTPIWWAAHMGHADIVRELIRLGADPDHDEPIDGLKPLHEAAKRNHAKTITALLEAGVNPLTEKTRDDPGYNGDHGPGALGQTAFDFACVNGHVEAVNAFLPFIQETKTFQRHFMLAASKGRTKVVARLLEVPEVNVDNRDCGCTALQAACISGDTETIEYLLKAGADPNNSFDDTEGRNILHMLYRASDWGVFDKLPDIFPLLIRAGVDIHQRDSYGMTPLHEIGHSTANSTILTRLLLQAEADANAMNNNGVTPLHYVGNIESMSLLIEEGHADINAVKHDGGTLLHTLLAQYHGEMTLKLLEYGPDCTIVDGHGNGMLHAALEAFRVEKDIVESLLDRGADPNLKNNKGLTPLLIAAGADVQEEIVDLLIKAGADINATGDLGESILFRHFETYVGPDSDRFYTWIKKGVPTMARDRKGRTVLHAAVRGCSYNQSISERIDPVLVLGLNANSVDYDGNGLLHELAQVYLNHRTACCPELVSQWEKLLSLGLDLDQANYDGLTPLHILCSAAEPEEFSHPGAATPIDLVISRMKNVDRTDKYGTTPLHRAVTIGEIYTKKLLEAGANPTKATHEGLTPLHLASRSRQSNVVGMLLDALRKRTPSSALPVLGVDALVFKFTSGYGFDELDSLAAYPTTPLFYACRSGRPETVALLLEAGADLKKGNVLQACAGFESENELWERLPKDYRGDQKQMRLMIMDEMTVLGPKRPFKQDKLQVNETTRLEEILNMLVEHGLDLTEISQADRCDKAEDDILKMERVMHQQDQNFRSISFINESFFSQKDYTGACFRAARDSARKEKDLSTMTLLESLHCSSKNAATQTLRSSSLIQSGEVHQDMLLSFLRRREFPMVEEMARLGVQFLPTSPREQSNFSILVQNGYFTLADKIGTIVAERELERGNWHAFGDKTRPGLWLANRNIVKPVEGVPSVLPFLTIAVMRELPNMEMVKLLLERFNVNVNELVPVDDPETMTYKGTSGASALHTVSLGRHWWQVHQALPYLLRSGADVNLRDDQEQTALHVALGGTTSLCRSFRRDAARLLIEAGADVNAVDKSEMDCLAYASCDVEMSQLLISRGAIVTIESIFGAIYAHSAPTLKVLLSGGISANTRRKPLSEDVLESQRKSRFSGARGGCLSSFNAEVEDHEEFPLYYAGRQCHEMARDASETRRRDADAALQTVKVLLEHGADPFANFLVPSPVNYGTAPENFREATVLHDLLYLGRPIDPFLQIPQLDIHRRDARGWTLLLAACSGDPDIVLSWKQPEGDTEETVTTFQKLLSMGADLEVLDNAGRNVLHLMIGHDDIKGCKSMKQIQKSLDQSIRRAPQLINQKDNIGNTPLHLAVLRMVEISFNNLSLDKPVPAEILISAGADYLITDGDGNSILHLLAAGLHTEDERQFFEKMVRWGTDVNGRNGQSETPLFPFCRQQTLSLQLRMVEYQSKVISMFKRLGADFFATDHNGRGLLHAAAGGEADFFKELMDCGLDAGLEDDTQQTPIDMAAAHGNREILKLFEKNM
ncbi:unnamed protein product [Clonostachys rosea]|uniref:Nephrocystin 3-like N-terminal domain-containing protein n=1 Tax=Bionectria ochroleuca TaxID=29856 RepID=A0ABY6U1T8_BIOOC|nr:unnamed protein product [Clonostachys rosea]